MSELHGEKIDIVDYSDDPAGFVANALSPARVSRVHVVDLAAREAQVIVPDYQLSLAIGKEGQNARLAARLTGWRIDIRSDAAPQPSDPLPEPAAPPSAAGAAAPLPSEPAPELPPEPAADLSSESPASPESLEHA
jgi:N utilization substance protein A